MSEVEIARVLAVRGGLADLARAALHQHCGSLGERIAANIAPGHFVDLSFRMPAGAGAVDGEAYTVDLERFSATGSGRRGRPNESNGTKSAA